MFDIKISEQTILGERTIMVNLEDISAQKQSFWERRQAVLQKKLMNSFQHNLKTPLNGITVLSQAGLQEIDSSKMREHFEDILRNSLILTNLLQFIQFYNKKEITYKDLKISHIKVQRILDNVSWLFERQLKQNNLTLTVELQDKNLKIINDASLIEFVLYQFLENSMQFSRQNGSIKIRVSPSDENNNVIIFSVVDEGAGIPPEKIQKILSADQSLELQMKLISSKNSYLNGAGLGFSICKRIIATIGPLKENNIKISSQKFKCTEISFQAFKNYIKNL